MGDQNVGLGKGFVFLLGLLSACTQQADVGSESLGERREELRVDGFSGQRPISAARACGSASDLAQIPTSFDSFESNLSDLVVAQ